jgi:hypothetical protein
VAKKEHGSSRPCSKQKRRELYEVYELAVLSAATLSTTLSLTASGEFVVVFHAFALRSFLTALLTMLTLLAGLLTALLATASRCLLAGALILAAGTHVPLLIVLFHSVVCHCCLFLPVFE